MRVKIESLIYGLDSFSPKIILANLLITITIYSLPIIVFRFLIYKKPVQKKTAKWIAIIYGFLAFVGMVVLKNMLYGTAGRMGGAAVIWGFLNYDLLTFGYSKMDDEPKEEGNTDWKWNAKRAKSDFQNQSSNADVTYNLVRKPLLVIIVILLIFDILLLILAFKKNHNHNYNVNSGRWKILIQATK